MSFCKLVAKKIVFSYGKEKILNGIDIEAEKGDILIIKGPNGSGKSTLLKVLSGILKEEDGIIKYLVGDNEIRGWEFPYYFGFCSAEQNLYEELTVFENLYFLVRIREKIKGEKIINYLKMANLIKEREKYYKNLSSGMKQKVKLISAVLHSPLFLFLDEPSTNLDENGINFLSILIEEQKNRGICFIATNDEREFLYGNKEIQLGI